MVIDDDHLRRLRLAARLEYETAFVELAVTTKTVINRRGDHRAQRVIVGKADVSVPNREAVIARVEVAPYKRDPADFVLWKPSSAEEPGWDSPWGRGRPGWHIECSAMSMRYLGASFDIHTGGVDLVFPHHTDEIAQSEAATGRTFVGYWLHNAFLQLGGQKMAKSTGNIERVPDIIGRGISGRALRLALISAHYRSSLTFGEESIAAASAAVERLDALFAALAAYREERADDPGLCFICCENLLSLAERRRAVLTILRHAETLDHARFVIDGRQKILLISEQRSTNGLTPDDVIYQAVLMILQGRPYLNLLADYL